MTNGQNTASEKPVAIVGAGSSGLAALKTLREAGLDAVAFEAGSGIGGNWRFRNDNGRSAAYASLHINTSKEKMAYSDFPMPEEWPDYPHHSQVLEYFEAYSDRFGLREHVRFRTEVERVEPVDDRWRVESTTREGGTTREEFRAVLVANGHHWCPRVPSFEGVFDGETLHSHAYETPGPFAGKRVLVVGIGNSAVDIACEVCRVAESTVLSTRHSAHILPKYAFGRPIDHFTNPAISRLPLWMQRLGFETILRFARGPQERLGVPKPDHDLLEAHPTVSSELLHLVGHGRLRIRADVDRLDGDGVRFVDGEREVFDTIVLATGYRIRFPFLSEEIVAPEKNEVRLYRNVVDPDRPGLFFVGLVQPLGATMPIAEAQSRWIARLLTHRSALPDRDTMHREIDRDRARVRSRYVKSDRHTIQVDFYPYLRQLEREMRRPSSG